MQRLVSFENIFQNCTSHTSCVKLIAQKLTKDKHPVVDFRILNTHIKYQNTATPPLRDIFSILGSSKCEILSYVDVKYTFLDIRLSSQSKEHCEILLYFRSPQYRYEDLPMGSTIGHIKCMECLTLFIEYIFHRMQQITIMDGLLSII